MTKMKLLYPALSLILAALSAFLYSEYRTGLFSRILMDYEDAVYRVERGIIESTPVYRDYVRPEIENELTNYNLAKHAAEVVKHGIKAMRNIDDINENVKSGRLVSLDEIKDKKYYFHNVKKEYRYLTPQAAKGLELVAETFQKKLNEKNAKNPEVKLAVSSVIRTVNYQEKVFGRKFVSTHSFGGCFDIFFEDFFVVLPEFPKGPFSKEKIVDYIKRRDGFLLGDALRRQFRSVLSETLLELQRRGVLYVFLENDRRCYHITILKKSI